MKVRFVESMNSQEVLDFNLYLSPYDVWVGTVTADGTGAKLTTDDKSCTVPAIPAAGQAFRNYQYQGATYSHAARAARRVSTVPAPATSK